MNLGYESRETEGSLYVYNYFFSRQCEILVRKNTKHFHDKTHDDTKEREEIMKSTGLGGCVVSALIQGSCCLQK
jgi:hypothetical protein